MASKYNTKPVDEPIADMQPLRLPPEEPPADIVLEEPPDDVKLEAPGMGKLSSTLVGAGQGFTAGALDNVVAGGGAFVDWLRAKLGGRPDYGTPEEQEFAAKDKTLGDRYREWRRDLGNIEEEAQTTNPYSYLGGNVAGALGAMASGVPLAAYGAGSGFWNSKADTTLQGIAEDPAGNLGRAAFDTGLGAGLGWLAGAAPVRTGVGLGVANEVMAPEGQKGPGRLAAALGILGGAVGNVAKGRARLNEDIASGLLVKPRAKVQKAADEALGLAEGKVRGQDARSTKFAEEAARKEQARAKAASEEAEAFPAKAKKAADDKATAQAEAEKLAAEEVRTNQAKAAKDIDEQQEQVSKDYATEAAEAAKALEKKTKASEEALKLAEGKVRSTHEKETRAAERFVRETEAELLEGLQGRTGGHGHKQTPIEKAEADLKKAELDIADIPRRVKGKLGSEYKSTGDKLRILEWAEKRPAEEINPDLTALIKESLSQNANLRDPRVATAEFEQLLMAKRGIDRDAAKAVVDRIKAGINPEAVIQKMAEPKVDPKLLQAALAARAKRLGIEIPRAPKPLTDAEIQAQATELLNKPNWLSSRAPNVARRAAAPVPESPGAPPELVKPPPLKESQLAEVARELASEPGWVTALNPKLAQKLARPDPAAPAPYVPKDIPKYTPKTDAEIRAEALALLSKPNWLSSRAPRLARAYKGQDVSDAELVAGLSKLRLPEKSSDSPGIAVARLAKSLLKDAMGKSGRPSPYEQYQSATKWAGRQKLVGDPAHKLTQGLEMTIPPNLDGEPQAPKMSKPEWIKKLMEYLADE